MRNVLIVLMVVFLTSFVTQTSEAHIFGRKAVTPTGVIVETTVTAPVIAQAEVIAIPSYSTIWRAERQARYLTRQVEKQDRYNAAVQGKADAITALKAPTAVGVPKTVITYPWRPIRPKFILK